MEVAGCRMLVIVITKAGCALIENRQRWAFESNQRRRFGQMQVADDRGGEFFRRMRNVEGQSVVWLFQVGELAREDGFSGEGAVPRFDVAAHQFVSSTEIDDAHIEAGGKQVAV